MMASNLRKAGSVLRRSFRSRRYASFDGKENTVLAVTTEEGEGRFRRNVSTSSHEDDRNASTSTASSSHENERNMSLVANRGSPAPPGRSLSQTWLKRGTSMTRSMRDAVGTLREKLKMSTRRGHLHVASRASTRRHTVGGRQAQRHSPFKASTPSRSGRTHIKTCLSKETPTRVRHEVESLTSNMQALNTLTPNTLEGRTRTRKTPPLTNGSLKTPRSARRHVITEIY